MDDYLELPLYIEDLEDGRVIDIWVMKNNHEVFAVLKNVDACIRHRGCWTIGHEYAGIKMVAFIPSDVPLYFNMLERDADV